MKYVILLRGINVGGKNKLPMAELRMALEKLGFKNVSSYIQSGNVLLESSLSARQVERQIEAALPKTFKLDSKLIMVLCLNQKQLDAVLAKAPRGFGTKPELYHSDVIFYKGISAKEALAVFKPHPEVDTIWPGKGLVYSQRLSAMRTKSRLGKIVGMPAYQQMTIRSWNTVKKLHALLQATS